MTQDWTADVKKYVANADDLAIKGIVKKLGLQHGDADLDKAIKDVCEKMKADRDKSRVAFYYLLAEKYGKLAMFH